MSEPFIIDAHLHTGYVGAFFAFHTTEEHLLHYMDRSLIRLAVCSDMLSIFEGIQAGIKDQRRVYEWSKGRIFYLGPFDPRFPKESLSALEEAVHWPGFRGVKIHPSAHGVSADDPSYRPVWEFVARHDVALMTHSWSASDYNPVQFLSVPERFEGYVKDYPTVRFILGHSGGRGKGRTEAIRMANTYPNVHMDFGGDIYCYRLMEELVESVPLDRILFGSDFPWMDPRSHITRVLLSRISESARKAIFCENALAVYRLDRP